VGAPGAGGGGGGAGGHGRDGGQGGTPAVPPYTLVHGIGRRGLGDGSCFFFVSFFCLSLSFEFLSYVLSLVRYTSSWDRPMRRAKGILQHAATARTADRRTGQNIHRHDLYKSHASMNKQKLTAIYSPQSTHLHSLHLLDNTNSCSNRSFYKDCYNIT